MIFKNFAVEHVTVDGTNYSLTAGTSDVNSGAIDLQGFSQVSILVALGTMAASSTVDAKLQHSSDNSNWSDILSSAVTQAVATDDDKCVGFSLNEPTLRYVRVAFTRGDGGNSIINAVFAIKKARSAPYTQAVTAGQFIAQPETLAGVAGTA
ncbi:MAG: hypothetical protein ACOYOL_07190 [Chthoniobacterales bacterium]